MGAMPEGDSVKRTAQRLDQLAGEVLTHADLRWPSAPLTRLAGRRVLGTRSIGKHLLTRLDAPAGAVPLTLHTHLRMEGAWRVWPLGAHAIPGPRSRARAVLATAAHLAVGFSLGMLDLVPTDREATLVGHLGPDVLGPDWDAPRAVEGLRASPEHSVGAALLDQRALAGVGTYWASEALFFQGLHPLTPVAAADPATVARMVERLPGLLGLGLSRRPDPAVYGRARRPCPRCGTPIAKVGIGTPPHQRELFFCPHCQPA